MKQIKLLFFSFNSILAVIIPRHGNGCVRRNRIERTNIPHPYLIYKYTGEDGVYVDTNSI